MLQQDKVEADQLYLLISHETADFNELKTRLDGQCRVRFQCIESPGNWCEFDEFGALLLPQAMIQGVVACLI